MAEGVLHRRVDSRRRDGKRHTHEGATAPQLYNRVAILIRIAIMRERGARELPHECDLRRHRVGVVGEDRAQHLRSDTRTLRHRHAKLRAGTAVLVANRRNPGGAPGLDRDVAAERGRDPGKKPRSPRARVDEVAHMACAS